MAFLDNSGDIILDAVLTDAGRERLARGDGSFKITKFAFGDDEINYELYNSNDSRGSAFYDLQILQTPVLEGFTNNTSSMKSKLITITRTNVLYLPIIKFNNNGTGYQLNQVATLASGLIAVAVDKDTRVALGSGADSAGIGTAYDAFDPKNAENPLILNQGLDTTAISKDAAIPPDLNETQYTIEMDNRLITLTDSSGLDATPSFIDDDSIASYSVSETTFVTDSTGDTGDSNAIAGPRGSTLTIGLRSTIDLQSSTYLFTTLGGTVSTYYFVDTNIRISGQTTGYRVDLPIRLLKKQ